MDTLSGMNENPTRTEHVPCTLLAACHVVGKTERQAGRTKRRIGHPLEANGRPNPRSGNCQLLKCAFNAETAPSESMEYTEVGRHTRSGGGTHHARRR